MRINNIPVFWKDPDWRFIFSTYDDTPSYTGHYYNVDIVCFDDGLRPYFKKLSKQLRLNCVETCPIGGTTGFKVNHIHKNLLHTLLARINVDIYEEEPILWKDYTK